MVKMHNNLQSNPNAYGELIKNLLVQGLIKLFEPSMILRVRKSDLQLVKSQIGAATKIYKELMLSQVVAFKDKKDIPCRVSVDEENFLPEWNE